MKRYEYSDNFNYEKYKAQEWNREHKAGGFNAAIVGSLSSSTTLWAQLAVITVIGASGLNTLTKVRGTAVHPVMAGWSPLV